MKSPFFSIIIPTYNRAHLISKSVDSVIEQTFYDWELIIVDDGSTDNTKALVDNYCNIDNRIRYIYQENAERSAARNNGINNAKGEYVCFLDSDDYYLPNHLLNLSKHISSDETIYYVGLVIEKDGKLTNRDETPVIGPNQFDQLCIATIHSQQVCIPSRVAKDYLFNVKIRIGEDLELWLRINIKYTFQYLPNLFEVVVVDHDERTISLKKNNTGIELLELYRYIFSKYHPGNNVSLYLKKRLISNCYFTIFKYWFYNFKRKKALYFLLKSIIANPNHEQTKFKLNLFIRLILFNKYSSINTLLK